MFNEEEEKLHRWKNTIEENQLPNDRLEQAIVEGFNRGKETKVNRRNKFLKRGFWSVAVAAILFVALITSIRVSPAFANAIASLPGMEKIVAMIQDNKGLVSAIENEYYQPLDITLTKEGISFTLDGAITDEKEMVIFYSISGSDEIEEYRIGPPDITAIGKPFWHSGTSGPVISLAPNGNPNKKISGMANIRFDEEVLTSDFKLNAAAKSQNRTVEFEIPFTISIEKAPTTIYAVNETVTIEGQKITIEQIEISPINTGIQISTDPNNTKRIFSIEDLRLVDEKGEIWSSITNGVVSTGWIYDDKMTYYLQSNYFENPGELTLMFNKLQAIDKEEAHLLIDTKKGLILEQPKDEIYSLVKSSDKYLELIVEVPEDYHKDPFVNFIDAEGNEVGFSGGSFSRDSEKQHINLSKRFSNEPYVNPIKIPLFGHPSYIEGEVKIKIK